MKPLHLGAAVLVTILILPLGRPARAQTNDGAATLTAPEPLTTAAPEESPNSSVGVTDETELAAQSSSSNPAQLTPAGPQAPSPGPPTLQDLGLAPNQTQANPQLQARLDRRSHMLKIHQELGLIAAVPMIATVATSFGAGGRSTSTPWRWTHLGLGAATGDLYFTSAYFAIRAPKIPGTPSRGGIRVHKALAWIHGPGMILTPVLGAMAFDEKSKGERVHGIAAAHGPVAIVTAGAYAAAILSVSIRF